MDMIMGRCAADPKAANPAEPSHSRYYPPIRHNMEFWKCISRHYDDTGAFKDVMGAFKGNSAFLRLVTALFGYDITKGVSSSDPSGSMLTNILQKFGDSDNDKVVLASIGSTLQICATLATPVLGGPGAGQMNFKLFCSFVERLYGCDLSDYDPDEIKDFRYHVMAFLKGRSSKERAGDYREEPQKVE